VCCVMESADCGLARRVQAGWWLLIGISTVSSDTTPDWLAISDPRTATRTRSRGYEILVS
jgi:hypothetical protein